jgi:large subunit ribosomal protein L25
VVEFKRVFNAAGESTMLVLETPTGPADVLIQEVATHPVSGEILHADLLVVDKTKKIEVGVPLRFEGLAPAVKDFGGILVKVLHELEIKVLPGEIPHDIEVDTSTLTTLDSQILVSDLKVPANIEVLNEPEAVVAAISVAKEEPVEVAPVDLAAIEVEAKGKKEEEGAAGEGEGAEKTAKEE